MKNKSNKNLLYLVFGILLLVGVFVFAKSNMLSSLSPASKEVVTDENTMFVEGGMFYFKPDVIKVKKGKVVKIAFKNVEGLYDFVIDELDVFSEIIKKGETTVVEFTPNKVGSFEYYCSVGDHRVKGMRGTLIVEE